VKNMVNNATIYETNADASLADRKELIRLIPIVVDFLKTNYGLDVEKAVLAYEQHLREHQQEQAKQKQIEEIENEKLAKKVATESYRLFFEHFAPYVNGQRVAWGYKFKIQATKDYPEHETKTIEREIMDKNIIPDGTVLTSKQGFLESIDKMIDGTDFIMPIKGSYGETPTFRLKRVKY